MQSLYTGCHPIHGQLFNTLNFWTEFVHGLSRTFQVSAECEIALEQKVKRRMVHLSVQGDSKVVLNYHHGYG